VQESPAPSGSHFQWLEAALRRRLRDDLNFRMASGASKTLPSQGCKFLSPCTRHSRGRYVRSHIETVHFWTRLLNIVGELWGWEWKIDRIRPTAVILPTAHLLTIRLCDPAKRSHLVSFTSSARFIGGAFTPPLPCDASRTKSE